MVRVRLPLPQHLNNVVGYSNQGGGSGCSDFKTMTQVGCVVDVGCSEGVNKSLKQTPSINPCNNASQ